MENKIKEIILSYGADVCGIAGIERFESAPKGFHPRDIYDACSSVIVFGRSLPKGLTQVSPRLIYGHYNEHLKTEVDKIAFDGAMKLEEMFDMIAVPMPCDSPYEYWEADTMTGKGLLSMKHAAVLAGIGQIGKSSLLLSEKYGNMLTIGAILTDKELHSDPLSQSICIEGCRKCIESCPSKAITENGVEQIRCRQYTYNTTARGFDTTDCNQCRMVCPVKYGVM